LANSGAMKTVGAQDPTRRKPLMRLRDRLLRPRFAERREIEAVTDEHDNEEATSTGNPPIGLPRSRLADGEAVLRLGSRMPFKHGAGVVWAAWAPWEAGHAAHGATLWIGGTSPRSSHCRRSAPTISRCAEGER
jgi:hypothetical protein